MAEEFKIKVGTELDTSGLEAKLKSVTNKNYKAKVGVEVTGEEDIAKALKNAGKNATIKAKVDIDMTDATTQVNKMLTQAQKFGKMSSVKLFDGKSLNDANDNLVKARTQLEAFINAGGKVTSTTKEWQDFNKALQESRTYAKYIKSDLDLQKVNKDLNQAKQNAKATIELWRQSHTAAEGMFGSQMDSFIADIDMASTLDGVRGVNKEFTLMTKNAKLAGVATMNFSDRLKQKAQEYASYLGVAGLAMSGIQALQAMAKNVLEVDTAMTGLYRVTDLTEQGYDKLYSNMISSAKEYGTTLTDTINATTDWVRAGFDANTALGLADVTAMYQHVSDLDYDEASKNLLTAYNGFKDSFETEFGGNVVASVEHIADAFNELDNQYSVTSAGLGEGLARSASALQMAGNTFEEAAALVGATSEVTQNPEKAGNAMKVLSLRLRGMKGELEELGEESEGVENISKMQGQILNMTKGRVNIFDDLGNFRSTYDIMVDIADVYDELSSTDQANLLETIAGKYPCQYAQKCA